MEVILQEGQRLSINIQSEGKLIEIIGSINKILNDRLFINLPPYFMRYINYFDVGEDLTIKVFTKIGTIDFNTIVISSPLEDEFAVEYDPNAVKFTASEEIPVISAILSLQIQEGQGAEEFYTTRTIEVASEYLKLYSDKKYQLEDTFDCKLILPKNYGTISFRATVTDIDSVYENEYTVSYSLMNEYDRQSLLYYMYVYTMDSNQD